MLKKLFLISFLLISSLPIFAKGSDLQITQTEYGLEVSTFNKKGKKIIEDNIVCYKDNLIFVLLKSDEYDIKEICKFVITNFDSTKFSKVIAETMPNHYKSHDFEDVEEFNKILILPRTGSLELWDIECKHDDLIINSVTINFEEKNDLEFVKKQALDELIALKRQEEIKSLLSMYPYTEGDYAFTINSNGTGLSIIYIGNEEEVKIPNKLRNTPVTEIAGWKSQTTKRIIIPSSVTSINTKAFYSIGLEKVEFEKNSTLTYIGIQAFANNQITEIVLPNSLKDVDILAFENNQLTKIPLPNVKIKVAINAFTNNPIKNLIIRKGWDFISTTTFRTYDSMYLELLETVEFEEGCKIIKHEAFHDCKKLKKVILPTTLYYIESDAFKDCISLTEVVVPDGTNIRTYGTEEFKNCPLDFESLKKLKQAGVKF